MTKEFFDLTGKVAIITGGAGLLGKKHIEAITEMGGIAISVDKNREYSLQCDITSREQVNKTVKYILESWGQIDILVNNAGMTAGQGKAEYFDSFEDYKLEPWRLSLETNLTGIFIMTQAVSKEMLKRGKGVILNIASDVGVISPDHRIYEEVDFNTPLSYCVCKHAIIGFTKWLATYYSDKGIRVNSLSPGGVFNDQPREFVERLTKLIPMGRMANADEYKAAVVFLVSDASSYMTGANLIIDGGRTCW